LSPVAHPLFIRRAMDSPDFSRRAFLQTATLALGSAAVASAQTAKPKIKVGYDNFAVRAMGWKAQLRLTKRFATLLGRGVQANKACVAVARELAGFVWAIGTAASREPPIQH